MSGEGAQKDTQAPSSQGLPCREPRGPVPLWGERGGGTPEPAFKGVCVSITARGPGGEGGRDQTNFSEGQTPREDDLGVARGRGSGWGYQEKWGGGRMGQVCSFRLTGGGFIFLVVWESR